MAKPNHDPSIFNEPHLQSSSDEASSRNPFLSGRTSEEALEAPIDVDPNKEGVDHTVWDEPTLRSNPDFSDAPEGQITYERWITAGIEKTTWLESLSLTLMLVLAAGPWGILGAIMSGSGADPILSMGKILGATILAPVTEEITKVAATLWVVEKRPYWFKSVWQILLCAVAGGALFAVIENLIYIYVYVPSGSEAFQTWRWTVCTGLHVSCSFLAGVGLVRIWDNAIRNRCQPELTLGMPYFATAMIGHGLYNFTVCLAEASGLLEF